MEYLLLSSSVEQLKGLIDEADHTHAFLPHRYEPDFKVYDFLCGFVGDPNFHIFNLVDTEGKRVGFIAVLPAKEHEAIYIGPMYITSEYQGRGLGRLQVVKLLEWARNNDKRSIRTKTWGQNYKSRKIFESLDFTVFEELPDQRVNGDSSVKYYLEL